MEANGSFAPVPDADPTSITTEKQTYLGGSVRCLGQRVSRLSHRPSIWMGSHAFSDVPNYLANEPPSVI